jgi:hypothetical protein
MGTISALAFVGQNANGILTWLTHSIAERASTYGVSMTVIDFNDEHAGSKLNACLAQGRPSFCFSFQGFGMHFRAEAGNLWSTLGVPFFSLMGDAPFHSPGLHANVGAGLFHVYTCEDFQQAYRDIMNGPNFSLVYPGVYPPNPFADQTPWYDRDLEVVYVKTGVDSNALRAKWAELPNKMREVLEDASAVALAGQKKTIAHIVTDAFAARTMHFGVNKALLLRVCSELDFYLRAVRAERMLREAMRHGAHIFGDWPHIEKAKTRARFHGTLPANQLNQLYARSRILLNISPSTLNFVHERIAAGLMAKAFIISDKTPFLDKALASYPNFKSVHIDSAKLPDEFDSRLADIRKMGASRDDGFLAMLEHGRRRSEHEFGADRFILEIIQMATVDQLERNSSFWAFPR